MAPMINNCCPSCWCKQKAHLEATGVEYACLYIPGHGCVRPNVCLNCGTVYVSKEVIDRINRGKKDGK